jgi:hypothetical protein
MREEQRDDEAGPEPSTYAEPRQLTWVVVTAAAVLGFLSGFLAGSL